MRVLIIGGSGFIGKQLVLHAPNNVDLTYSFFSSPLQNTDISSIKLDLLDKDLKWDRIIEGFDAIMISARPNGDTKSKRDIVASKTAESLQMLVDTIRNSKKKPFLVAIHGSLSYGDRGDDLVQVSPDINPIGFAESYAIGEKPIRDYYDKMGMAAIIRAPWVLGKGSWYQGMYGSPDKIPYFAKNPWMSIVDSVALAKSAWDCLLKSEPGIFHPILTYRCRQNDFAEIVKSVTKKTLVKQGWFRLLLYESQMKNSVLASIKLDDQQGDASEKETARKNLVLKIKHIHSDF